MKNILLLLCLLLSGCSPKVTSEFVECCATYRSPGFDDRLKALIRVGSPASDYQELLLTRISHTRSTATGCGLLVLRSGPNCPRAVSADTALRKIRPAPRNSRSSRRLVTKGCEKCGLTADKVVHVDDIIIYSFSEATGAFSEQGLVVFVEVDSTTKLISEVGWAVAAL